MKKLALILSCLALVLVIGPPLAYLAGSLGKASMNAWMLAGTVLWFVTVPFWMGRRGDEA